MNSVFAYVKLENDSVIEYPVWELALAERLGLSSTSSPAEILAASQNTEYVPVESSSPPVVTYDKEAIEVNPVNENGVWKRSFVIQDISEEEKARRTEFHAKGLRARRNDMLSDCDWTQLADAPLTDAQKTAWAAYRQELRDVPSQSGFPWNVTWPVKP